MTPFDVALEVISILRPIVWPRFVENHQSHVRLCYHSFTRLERKVEMYLETDGSMSVHQFHYDLNAKRLTLHSGYWWPDQQNIFDRVCNIPFILTGTWIPRSVLG